MKPRVHVLLLLGQVCFAALPVAGRLAMQGNRLPPAGIVMVRMCGGALAFAAIARARGVLRIRRADVPFLVLCALLGVAANQELFIHGLARSTATNASVLGATIPVFTALTALLVGREAPRLRRLLGIAVAFGGATALVGIEGLSLESEHVAGSAMVLANSLCYGSYLVLVRPMAARYDPMALLAVLFAIGVPMVTPLGVHAWMEAPPIGMREVLFLAFLVAVPTVGAYTFVQTALRDAESSVVAVYVNLQPVFVAVAAWGLLDETLTLRTAICGGIVLVGVYVATRK